MKIIVTGFDPFGGEPINPALKQSNLYLRPLLVQRLFL